MRPENLDFIALFVASGWTQAETARQLKTTRATLSRCLSGAQTPSAPLVKLFELILANRRPGALTAIAGTRAETPPDWERRIFDDLRSLREEDRERVLTALRAILDALPKRDDATSEPPAASRSAAVPARPAAAASSLQPLGSFRNDSSSSKTDPAATAEVFVSAAERAAVQSRPDASAPPPLPKERPPSKAPPISSRRAISPPTPKK